jgi:lipoprotein-releasing system permease protein
LGVEKFIADRILGSGLNKGNISKPIVKIGIIGIALGMSVMLLTVSIVLGFKNEIIGKIRGLTTDIAISSINVNSSNEPEAITIGSDTLNLLRNLPFVKHVQRTSFKNGLLKTKNENEGILLKGVDSEYDFGFIAEHLSEGRLPVLNDSISSRDILISGSLANKMDLHLEEKILVHFITQREIYDSIIDEVVVSSEHRSRKFTICGIFRTDFADFDDKLSFVDIRQLQRINNWEDNEVANYELKVRDFTRLGDHVEQIRELVGYSYNVSHVKELYFNIFIWLEKLDINGVIIVVLMILVATINMITALLILILERTNMVGLLKALGMSNANVRSIFLRISLKLTLKGMLWGNIAGIGLCLLQYYFEIARLDSQTYYVDHVAVALDWKYFILLNVGTLITCASMLVLPTLIITRLTPVKTLKFD